MFTKLIALLFLAIGVNCRYVFQPRSPVYIIDGSSLIDEDWEDGFAEKSFESVHPVYLNSRVRRQVQGVMNSNPDGSLNIMGKLPLAGNDQNKLSAIGGINGAKPGGGFGSAFGGASLDNV